MPSEKIDPAGRTPARKKLEQGISAFKQGAVSMGYVLDALDQYEAEAALLAVKQERERCARLVVMHGRPMLAVDPSDAELIAAAIRKG